MVNQNRVSLLKKGTDDKKGPVVYWMSREQRVFDNWAMFLAVEKANEKDVPLHVVFALSQGFLGANLRHYVFMIEGLKEVENQLGELGIAFHVLYGEPEETVPDFIAQIKASLLVSDFDPLRIKLNWKSKLNSDINISHVEVDSHNIVPCKYVSQKLEFGAYTIRPKINRLLTQFLVDFETLPKLKNPSNGATTNWEALYSKLSLDSTIKPVEWLLPGFVSAIDQLNQFLVNGLERYSKDRNDPLKDGQSNLSPYLHFGHLSAQRVAIEVSKSGSPAEDKTAFLEELIVRRELSDNFCYYNSDYDNVNGFHQWALVSHGQHRNDEREFLYTQDEFENAKTHDELWNAAQMEMVKKGKMHGYMRMYWAKKILEWTISPEQAMSFAIYLNDKYSLDGRDPNGYAGIAWSIGGVHDRAWSERPVFGKIRYMNYNGCKRKFNVDGYIEMISRLK